MARNTKTLAETAAPAPAGLPEGAELTSEAPEAPAASEDAPEPPEPIPAAISEPVEEPLPDTDEANDADDDDDEVVIDDDVTDDDADALLADDPQLHNVDTFVVQVERDIDGALKWVDTLAAFPTDGDAVDYLKAIASEEREKLFARRAAGSQGGDTGRYRVILRETEEVEVTVVDFLDPEEEPVEDEPVEEPTDELHPLDA